MRTYFLNCFRKHRADKDYSESNLVLLLQCELCNSFTNVSIKFTSKKLAIHSLVVSNGLPQMLLCTQLIYS